MFFINERDDRWEKKGMQVEKPGLFSHSQMTIVKPDPKGISA